MWGRQSLHVGEHATEDQRTALSVWFLVSYRTWNFETGCLLGQELTNCGPRNLPVPVFPVLGLLQTHPFMPAFNTDSDLNSSLCAFMTRTLQIQLPPQFKFVYFCSAAVSGVERHGEVKEAMIEWFCVCEEDGEQVLFIQMLGMHVFIDGIFLCV